ncbi:DUF1129 family protein [Neobacillus terrae]|uniref:DUF1129 family protein n=1 Tax=Neobacillus terrae TaxID=3034837 RepID=UPI001409FD06|nr:DUF1129 family protein [Neobacillus terrae]
MKAKQLIEENNRKRELLNPQNEKYYMDMLLYIRLQLTLSEQQSEEVLIEMLDHLLDGQQEGKSAQDIFGDDPKGYADEIIENLPKERKRKVFPFISGIVINIVSWFLMIRGVIILAASQFKSIPTTIYPFTALIEFAVTLGITLFGVWYIFRIIRQSLFQNKTNEKKNMLKVGLFAAFSMLIFMLINLLIPKFGPTFQFNWWSSVLVGGGIWAILSMLKKFEVGFN